MFEAKDDKSYTLKRVRDDLQIARGNRGAQVGVFVWSKNSAPEGTEPLSREGSDIIVVWNPEDAATDVYLKAAVSLARLMVVQEKKSSDNSTADLTAIESATAAITRDLGSLDEITTWANTIKNNGDKISTKASSMRKRVEEQLETVSHHSKYLINLTSRKFTRSGATRLCLRTLP